MTRYIIQTGTPFDLRRNATGSNHLRALLRGLASILVHRQDGLAEVNQGSLGSGCHGYILSGPGQSLSFTRDIIYYKDRSCKRKRPQLTEKAAVSKKRVYVYTWILSLLIDCLYNKEGFDNLHV